MQKVNYRFSEKSVSYYFDESLANLSKYVDPKRSVLIIDEKVNSLHGNKLKGWKKILIKGEESSKSLISYQRVMDELIRLETDRKTTLVGIGGGVTTDLCGFVASTYMRGVPFGFVPTTLLAQVDASIGGKNGVNYALFKNILGIIRQPDFLLFDYSLLNTLDEQDFHCGFAEVIKYGCIWDEKLFDFLERQNKKAVKRDAEVIHHLVRRSVEIKSEVVQKDEFEGGLRRLLNFGHTIGHAMEKIEKVPHGYAVAKGMVVESRFSNTLSSLKIQETQRIITLLKAYRLPIDSDSEPREIETLFRMDKKREKDFIHFVLLDKIGKAQTKPLKLEKIASLLEDNRDKK